MPFLLFLFLDIFSENSCNLAHLSLALEALFVMVYTFTFMNVDFRCQVINLSIFFRITFRMHEKL